MADDKRIFSLRYMGERFRNHRMPVEVLSDLPAFRDLLLSFAKDQWRDRHPDRRQIPKNFDKDLTMSLFEIADGSARPKLEWSRRLEDATLFGLPDEMDEIVEGAYADVIALIVGSDTVTPELSTEKVRALNRFGASLKEDEKIELPVRGTDNVVYLDMLRRKQLIMGARETYQTRFEGSGELVGTLSPSDPAAQCHVQVQTDQHGIIHIPLDRLQLYEEFASALNSEVQFDLMVELDRQDKLRAVVEVFDVGVVDDPVMAKINERLEELERLQDGWQDGEGNRIARIALANTQSFIAATPRAREFYRIFPTDGGGVLIDLTASGWEYSVEFGPSGVMEMYGIEADGPDEMQPTAFEGVDALIDEFVRRVGLNVQ